MSQGKTKVTSIDDNEDLEFTHEAFRVGGGCQGGGWRVEGWRGGMVEGWRQG